MKRKNIIYIIGLCMTLITFIPPLPRTIKFLLAFIPLVFFLLEILFGYIQRLLRKNYINEYLSILLGTLFLTSTGRITYSALTVIFCSTALYIFKTGYDKNQFLFDESCRIIPKSARIITPDGIKTIATQKLNAGCDIVVKEGDIIPTDGFVINGSAVLDYTNIFGPSEPVECQLNSKCYSGGIVQKGKLVIKTANPASACYAATIEAKTKNAHKMSDSHAKILNICEIFQPAVMVLSVIVFIILMIATKSYGYSMNVAAVIMFASLTIALVKILPLIYHISLLSARKKGIVIKDTEALEKLPSIKILAPNEKLTQKAIQKIEETGIVLSKNSNQALDAVLYREKAVLETETRSVFKIAQGFFSDKADMTVCDGSTERIPGAIRISRNFKNIFRETLICLGVEKSALLLLVIFLNITPAVAIIIEFAAWMICLVNATKKI